MSGYQFTLLSSFCPFRGPPSDSGLDRQSSVNCQLAVDRVVFRQLAIESGVKLGRQPLKGIRQVQARQPQGKGLGILAIGQAQVGLGRVWARKTANSPQGRQALGLRVGKQPSIKNHPKVWQWRFKKLGNLPLLQRFDNICIFIRRWGMEHVAPSTDWEKMRAACSAPPFKCGLSYFGFCFFALVRCQSLSVSPFILPSHSFSLPSVFFCVFCCFTSFFVFFCMFYCFFVFY